MDTKHGVLNLKYIFRNFHVHVELYETISHMNEVKGESPSTGYSSELN